MSEKVNQEAEDVALIDKALDDLSAECGHLGWSGDCDGSHRPCRECMTPILAHLVRKAQVRELEAVAKRLCGCSSPGFPFGGYCGADPLHARIAALRQEG